MSTAGYIAGAVKKPRHPKVAAWVQAIRKASGARSQEALAEVLGVSRSGVAKWYYGEQRPQLDELQKLETLAKKLGLPAFADFDPAQPPEITGMSDPDRTVPLDSKKRRYEVDCTEGTILAKKFDAMPETQRTEALRACLNALAELEHPSELGADKKRHRAQHS